MRIKPNILISSLFLCLTASSMSSTRATDEIASLVPKNITECILRLKSSLPQATINSLKKGKESTVYDLHLTVGGQIRNDWIRKKGSPALVQYFSKMGITNPDDMSAIILTSLWRDLHEKPLQIDEQVKSLRETNRFSSPQVSQKRIVPTSLWDQTLPLSTGARINFQSWKGKVIIVLVAFRDYRSIQAAQSMNVLKKKFGENLQVLTILHAKLTKNAQVTPEMKSNFINSAKPEYPTVVDVPNGLIEELNTAFIVPGNLELPETILIGKNGYMITRYQSWNQSFEDSLEKDVEKALQAK